MLFPGDGDVTSPDVSWSYTGFSMFREWLAHVEGFTLVEMNGFGGDHRWSSISTALAPLLSHPDDDGSLTPAQCAAMLPRLETIIDQIPHEDCDPRCPATRRRHPPTGHRHEVLLGQGRGAHLRLTAAGSLPSEMTGRYGTALKRRASATTHVESAHTARSRSCCSAPRYLPGRALPSTCWRLGRRRPRGRPVAQLVGEPANALVLSPSVRRRRPSRPRGPWPGSPRRTGAVRPRTP